MTYTASALKAQLDIFNFVHLSGGKIIILVSVADQGGSSKATLDASISKERQADGNRLSA